MHTITKLTLEQAKALFSKAQPIKSYHGAAGCGCGCRGSYSERPATAKNRLALAERNVTEKAAEVEVFFNAIDNQTILSFESAASYQWFFFAGELSHE